MAGVMDEYNVPGMAMAIRFPDGSALRHAAGVADLKTREPLTVEHHFRIGSATKTFTAAAILLLYQEKLLDLDAPVETLLPDLEDYNSLRGSGITVRMLLRHESGLQDYIAGMYDGEHVGDILMREPTRTWDPQELVRVAVDMGMATEAGEAFDYSNTNYILLGLIIEEISGKTYEQFVQEEILDSLGLENTIVPVSTGLPNPYAHGYLEKDADNLLYDYTEQHPSGVWSAGNIISTTTDLLSWLEVLINGPLLHPAVREEQFDFGSSGYGLGVARLDEAVGHNGTVMGYQVWMVTDKGASFVIYNNCYYLQEKIGHVSEILHNRIQKTLEK